jgi:uncharacterized protein YjbJ (UPF0337 family)
MHYVDSEEVSRMARESGPEAAVKGVVEDLKGKAKEAAAAIKDDPEMRREGRAQQEKAGNLRDAAAKEAEAEKYRAAAAAREAEQRTNQK